MNGATSVLFRAFSEWNAALLRVIPILDNFAQQFSAALWAGYRLDGMPYGETEAGLCRWLRVREGTVEE